MKIIRTRQRPFLVVVDAFFTILAWIGLLYLLVRGLLPLIGSHEAGPRIDVSVLDALSTLEVYLWVALVNAALLIAWARHRQRKSRGYPPRLPAPVVDDQRLSESFKLSDENFTRIRLPGTMVVHNDEEGGISHVATQFYRIEPEDQLHPPLAAVTPTRVIHLPDEDGKDKDKI